jgi:hypothetical protein
MNMDALRTIQRYVWVAIGFVALYTGWLILERHGWWRGSAADGPSESAITVPADLGGAVRIVQFYAREGVVTEGSSTVICYGVMNATAVRIDPPVADVWPSQNRCIEVRPARETKYTLTAEGAGGSSVSESFRVEVAPDAALLPKITSFRIAGCHKDYLGEPVFKISFTDQNAVTVDFEPLELGTLHGGPYGQFYVAPKVATTYTMKVTGKHGRVARAELKVDPKECR